VSYGFSDALVADLRRQLSDAQQMGAEALACRDKALETAREEAGYAARHLRRATELRTLLRHYVDNEHADQYIEPDASPAADSRRAEFLDGLRKVTEYYELHPDLPTPHGATMHVFPERGNPDQECAEVTRIATAMGLTAERKRPNCHFSASMRFSNAVEIAVATTSRTDHDWKNGDELPQWFLHEQATYAPQKRSGCEGAESVGAAGGAR